jgi:thiamine-monophosphate kinase
MLSIKESAEERLISQMCRAFRRAPYQVNQTHECDAELIPLNGTGGGLLAVTTDSLIEELSLGLYTNPWFMGWMLATVNFSDLAAVGARPLGLLIALSIPQDHEGTFISDLSAGISAACERAGSFVIGGDTNLGESLILSATAIGTLENGNPLTRIGCRPGDRLYLSGPAGAGNAFAFTRLTTPDSAVDGCFFMPVARIAEGQRLRGVATCCMDTSDGVLHTVDTLAHLNHCGALLENDWARMLHPAALQICASARLAPWLTLAGLHGEYELCFTIGKGEEEAFLESSSAAGWNPLRIGEITAESGVGVRTSHGIERLDTEFIRSLAATAGRDHQTYIRELINYANHIAL